MDRTKFLAQAKPITVVINGQPLLAEPKEFSTGSLGYYCGGKLNVEVGGEIVKLQVGLNLTVVGSKEFAKA